MPVVSRLYRLASVKHADTCGLVLLFGIVVGFSDDRRLLVLILLVFFVLVVIIIVVWVSRRQCLPVMPTDNQVEKFSRMCGVMSVPLGMSHRSLVRAATGLAPSKRPPRQRGTAGHLSGRDRSSRRPTLGSLAAGSPTRRAIRKACQRNPSPRLVPMPIGPAVGGRDVERLGPCQARRDRGRHEEGLPNLRCADGIETEGKGIRAMFEVYSRNVEPRLYQPDAAPTIGDERWRVPAHLGRCGQLHHRTTGRPASVPLGPYCSTHPGYGGPVRDQPPARTRPVLRSTAQSQTPTSTYLLATNSGGRRRSASRTEAAQTSRPRQRVFHQMLRADVRTHGDHIAAVRTISTNESPVSPTATHIENSARHPEALPWRSIPPVR